MLRGLREFQIRSTESCKKFHSPTKIFCKNCILGKQSYLKPTDHICQVCKDFHLSNAQVFANISETFHKIFIYKYFAKISQLFTKLITNILQTFHNFSQTSGKHFTAFDKHVTKMWPTLVYFDASCWDFDGRGFHVQGLRTPSPHTPPPLATDLKHCFKLYCPMNNFISVLSLAWNFSECKVPGIPHPHRPVMRTQPDQSFPPEPKKN